MSDGELYKFVMISYWASGFTKAQTPKMTH